MMRSWIVAIGTTALIGAAGFSLVAISFSGTPHGGTLSYSLSAPTATDAPGPPIVAATDPPRAVTYVPGTPAATPVPTAPPTPRPTFPPPAPPPSAYFSYYTPPGSVTWHSATGSALPGDLCTWGLNALNRDRQLDEQDEQEYPQFAQSYATSAGYWMTLAAYVSGACQDGQPVTGEECTSGAGWLAWGLQTHEDDLAAAHPVASADWNNQWIVVYNKLIGLWGTTCAGSA